MIKNRSKGEYSLGIIKATGTKQNNIRIVNSINAITRFHTKQFCSYNPETLNFSWVCKNQEITHDLSLGDIHVFVDYYQNTLTISCPSTTTHFTFRLLSDQLHVALDFRKFSEIFECIASLYLPRYDLKTSIVTTGEFNPISIMSGTLNRTMTVAQLIGNKSSNVIESVTYTTTITEDDDIDEEISICSGNGTMKISSNEAGGCYISLYESDIYVEDDEGAIIKKLSVK